MRKLQVKQLTNERLEQAFPLMQSSDPGLSLDRWLAFASQMMVESTGGKPAPSGIMTVENEQSYIAGLFSYRCHQDLHRGKTLTAENFVALDFLDPRACAEALGTALDHLARQLGCSAILSLLNVSGPKSEGCARMMESVLRERGHETRGQVLCKAVEKQLSCLRDI